MSSADSPIIEPSGIESSTRNSWSNTVDADLKYRHRSTMGASHGGLLQHHFHAAMVPPAWVKRTAEALKDARIRVASFIDFPLGTMTSAGKAQEAKILVAMACRKST